MDIIQGGRLRCPPLPDRLLLPLSLDLSGVLDEVSALENSIWTRHFVTRNFSGDWDVIALRAPASASHPILKIAPHPDITDWVDTEELRSSPRLARLLEQFHCPLGAVRLMRLMPGSTIYEHSDPGLDAAAGTVRLHIPLQTDAGVAFMLNHRRVPMRVGECWYLRLQDPHSVRHEGQTARIHLVMDAPVNDWLIQLLTHATELQSHNAS